MQTFRRIRPRTTRLCGSNASRTTRRRRFTTAPRDDSRPATATTHKSEQPRKTMTVRTDDNAGTISHDQGPVERRRATTRTMRHEHDPDRPCADPRAQMSDVLPTSSSRPSPRTAASPPPRRAGGAFGPSLSDDLRTCPLAFICRDPPRPPENVGKGGSEGSPKGPTGIQAGRRAPGHFHCGSCRRDPDAAVKGTLRRPPAALDRRSFRLEALAPNESGTTGAVEPSGRNVRHMGEGRGAGRGQDAEDEEVASTSLCRRNSGSCGLWRLNHLPQGCECSPQRPNGGGATVLWSAGSARSSRSGHHLSR